MGAPITTARLKWPQAKIVHYHPGEAYLSEPWSTDDPTATAPASISLPLFGGFDAVVEKEGRTQARKVVPGRVTLCGLEPIQWLSGSASAEFIEITASAQLRRDVAGELGVPEHVDLDDMHDLDDPIIWAIATRLRSAARDTIRLSDLERDVLLRQLYARVLETRFGGRKPGRGDGGLDQTRLSRVLEFIEAHLDAKLTVPALADVAALSSFHFIRAFRQSVGVTPQRYVRSRRLELARELIAAGVAPRVAGERIGYDSPGHFRAAYRAHFGRSYREAAKPGPGNKWRYRKVGNNGGGGESRHDAKTDP